MPPPTPATHEPGERVGLVVLGAVRQGQLIGMVHSVQEDIVEVVLADPRLSELAPGRLVSLRTPTRPPELLQVVEVTSGWEPRVVLRTMATPGGQQRRELRHVLVQPRNIMVTVLRQGRGLAFRVVVLDVSPGGLGVLAQRPLETGDRLRIRLPLGGSEEANSGREASVTTTTTTASAVDLVGEVAWVLPFGRRWRAGIRFAPPTAVQFELLDQLAAANDQEWQRLLDQADAP